MPGTHSARCLVHSKNGKQKRCCHHQSDNYDGDTTVGIEAGADSGGEAQGELTFPERMPSSVPGVCNSPSP